MSSLLTVFFNVDFLKIALPASGAIVAWYLNERSKVRSEQVQRKEERYKELLRCLKGFYSGRQDAALKAQFVDQVNLCWLYAQDAVIRSANAFFDSIDSARPTPASDVEKRAALASLILAIRKDMLSRKWVSKTNLNQSEWKNVHA